MAIKSNPSNMQLSYQWQAKAILVICSLVRLREIQWQAKAVRASNMLRSNGKQKQSEQAICSLVSSIEYWVECFACLALDLNPTKNSHRARR